MSVVREVDSYDPCVLPYRDHAVAVSNTPYESLKRILDLGLGCVALVLLAPLLVVAALAIKLTSRGPVLFRGTVIGRYGQPFTYYKLRTMRADADDSAHRQFIAEYVTTREGTSEAVADGKSGGRRESVYKLIDDPRITPVGRILRKTSLDEVAQLINVLRGEMSLVGPRPPVLYEFQLYKEHHRQRLAVLPGITGLAQVRARSRASFEEMVEIDLEYIRHRSLGSDLAILVRTVWVVLSGQGAH